MYLVCLKVIVRASWPYSISTPRNLDALPRSFILKDLLSSRTTWSILVGGLWPASRADLTAISWSTCCFFRCNTAYVGATCWYPYSDSSGCG
jgi:hypothetical protein